MITLRAQLLSAETSHLFAPFGSLIQASPGGAAINSGGSQRHEAVPALDLQREGGRAVLAVYTASARRLPFSEHGLERHRLSDQVFLPLAGARRCVLLVAPAGLHQPRPEDCLAFATQGHQGVRIATGTWHLAPGTTACWHWTTAPGRCWNAEPRQWTATRSSGTRP